MKTNRRDFFKILGSAAALTIIPRHVMGRGYIAPSDQLTKGIIGTGSMGRGHVDYAGTRLVAVCDVDKKHLELGKHLVTDNIAAYHDFRDLILDKNVDIVHIATPVSYTHQMCIRDRIYPPDASRKVIFGEN